MNATVLHPAEKLAGFYEPEAPRQPLRARVLTREVLTFRDELAEYRRRHPHAHATRTPARMGSLCR